MKLIKTLIFPLLFFNLNFSQNNHFSEYEKYDYDGKNLNYSKLLGIDENYLILKVDNQKFIVYGNNNEVYKINVGYLSNSVLYKEKISNDKCLEFRKILDELTSINPNILNETKDKKTSENIIIQDCLSFNLKLIKNKYFVNYNSYCLEEYIEKKVDFFEERIKFFNIIKKLDLLFHNKEFDTIRKMDTIVFKSPSKNIIEKLKIIEDSNKTTKTFSFGENNDNILFIDKNTANKSYKYLIGKSDKIYSFELFDLYGLEILKNPKKTIFIIENKVSNKRKTFKASYINTHQM